MQRQVIQLTLNNPRHPSYGECSVSLPISEQQYDGIIDMLQELEIGDAIKSDCHVVEVNSSYPFLKRLEGREINIEEFDCLAQHLKTFDDYEVLQFQAMAEKMSLFDLRSLINLALCCQQVTVVSDFSDLEKIGRWHYMTIHGNSIPNAEMNGLDAVKIARQLLQSTAGTVTSFGVVYDNGLQQLRQVYTGRALPLCCPNGTTVVAGLCKKGAAAEDRIHACLPMAETRLSRTLDRADIQDTSQMEITVECCVLSQKVTELLGTGGCTLEELNQISNKLAALTKQSICTLEAAICLAQPKDAKQLGMLAEPQMLDGFTLLPKVRTTAECGEYLIKESGHYTYDENLSSYYNYEALGWRWLQEHPGAFNRMGYISYDNEEPLESIFDPTEQQEPVMEM